MAGGAWWAVKRAGTGTEPALGPVAAAGSGASTGCSGLATGMVRTTADYAPLLRVAAQSWADTKPAIDGTCVSVQVQVTPSLVEAAGADGDAVGLFGAVEQLSRRRAAFPATDTAPAVTILGRTYAGVAATPATLSSLGWATKTPTWAELAQALGQGALGGGPAIAMADPAGSHSSTASVAALVAAAQGNQGTDVNLDTLATPQAFSVIVGLIRGANGLAASQGAVTDRLVKAAGTDTWGAERLLAFVDEATVAGVNATSGKADLRVVFPGGRAAWTEIGYLPLPVKGTATADRIGAGLLGYLQTEAGRAALGKGRLRDDSGAVLGGDPTAATPATIGAMGAPAPAVATALTTAVTVFQNPGRCAVAIDVSGSMRDLVPGTGKTKLQFAQQIAAGGISFMPGNGAIGVWEFSTRLDGPKGYRELVPTRKLNEVVGGKTQLELLLGAVQGMRPQRDTALYATTLEVYRSMVASYTPGTTNFIVIITDGRNEDPGSIELPQLVSQLQDLTVPGKPVPIYTIAYGADADLASLRTISATTGGASYHAVTPTELGKVFLRILMPR